MVTTTPEPVAMTPPNTGNVGLGTEDTTKLSTPPEEDEISSYEESEAPETTAGDPASLTSSPTIQPKQPLEQTTPTTTPASLNKASAKTP